MGNSLILAFPEKSCPSFIMILPQLYLKPLLPSIPSHSYTHSEKSIFHPSQPFFQNSPGFMAQTLPSRHYISLPHNCLLPLNPKYFVFKKTLPVITMQIVTVVIS